MIDGCMRTRDGRFRVDLYADQTAQVSSALGTPLTARLPLWRIGRWMNDNGVDSSQLEPA